MYRYIRTYIKISGIVLVSLTHWQSIEGKWLDENSTEKRMPIAGLEEYGARMGAWRRRMEEGRSDGGERGPILS